MLLRAIGTFTFRFDLDGPPGEGRPRPVGSFPDDAHAAAGDISSATLPQTHPDFPLVHRVRTGDQAALGEIFMARYAALCAFSSAIVRNPDVAEDVVHGVFSKIWERRDTWMPARGIAAYLFGAVRNESYHMLRTIRAHTRIGERLADTGEAPGMGAGTPSPDAAFTAADRITAVWEAIARLPHGLREILYLRWRQRLSWDEMAAVLGTTQVAVKRQHARALEAIRKRLPGFVR